MGLLDKVVAKLSGKNAETEKTAPSASDYVEWLPSYMFQKGNNPIRLDSNKPLPGAGEAPAVPQSDAVVNRLKVLCGLNPFRFSEPAEGSFDRMYNDHKLSFTAKFEDTPTRSVCTLKLSIRS